MVSAWNWPRRPILKLTSSFALMTSCAAAGVAIRNEDSSTALMSQEWEHGNTHLPVWTARSNRSRAAGAAGSRVAIILRITWHNPTHGPDPGRRIQRTRTTVAGADRAAGGRRPRAGAAGQAGAWLALVVPRAGGRAAGAAGRLAPARPPPDRRRARDDGERDRDRRADRLGDPAGARAAEPRRGAGRAPGLGGVAVGQQHPGVLTL